MLYHGYFFVESLSFFADPITFFVGNAIATVKSSDSLKLLTIRPTAFPPSAATGGSAKVENSSVAGKPLSKWVSEQIVKSDRPELGAAKIIVSGGRGLKSADNFKLMYDLADKLGAAGKKLGAARV